MGVIIDFLKLLGSIRTGIAAVWLASGFFAFAPKVWPRLPAMFHITLPGAWQSLPVGVFVVTSFVLLIWIIQALGRHGRMAGADLGRSIAQRWHRRQAPTKCEQLLLFAFTEAECVNLNAFTGAYNRLELNQARDALARKGLVRINPLGDNLLTLTPRGERAAMVLLEQERRAGDR